MIWMLVHAVRVVGDHDLRAVLVDQAADPVGDIAQRDVAERLRAVPVLPFRHAGIVVAEQLKLGDAEVLACLAQLGQPGQSDARPVVALLAWLEASRAPAQPPFRTGSTNLPHPPP